MNVEYRVVWKREGAPRLGTRRYQRRSSAERFLGLLTGDQHLNCSHHPGYGEPPWCYWDQYTGSSEPPPWVIEPRIEVRSVGSWGPRQP